jgi:hypothetical protein
VAVTDPLADWWQHAVKVRRFQGTGAKGNVYAAEDDLRGLVDDSNKLVTDATGEQVVSSARVFLPAGTAAIPLDSEVTLTGPFLGRTTTVIAVSVHDAGSQDTPNHVELALR